ncbi:MAG TPA: FAD-dependent oxidoreductase [Pyrinomonadaceae bacterium]|jgi:2-polyprenyl-6-methoxyphenol hydroxylase-like FAD-dependent oxidoreductase
MTAVETEISTELETPEVSRTTCCVVGGGPAGVILSLLLARRGVAVTLLEAHDNFDRDFRGDTIHPSVLELLDEIGLAGRLHQLPHAKIHTGALITAQGPVTFADFRRLRTRFPYIMMLPQKDFLAFVAREAEKYPSFRLLFGARVEGLIEEGGVVRGVRYEGREGPVEMRAELTVGADGRGSRLRHLGGFEQVKTSPPMDILWFRVPRAPEDPDGGLAFFGGGHMLVMLNRGEQWQAAYVILKGSSKQVRAAGPEALRRALAGVAPQYAGRFEHLRDWKQVSTLSVESSRVKRWFRPGLLLVGDAAHVMSPVGGVGINYAIMDAAEAANVLAAPLKEGTLDDGHLREVQRRREWPTRLIQAFQARVQKRVVAAALDPGNTFRVPLALRLLLRVPVLRNLPARFIGLGFKRVHVEP